MLSSTVGQHFIEVRTVVGVRTQVHNAAEPSDDGKEAVALTSGTAGGAADCCTLSNHWIRSILAAEGVQAKTFIDGAGC